MNEIFLLKMGEIALKGLNRRKFEDKLSSNIKRRLQDLGEFKIQRAQSTIYVEPQSEDIDMEEAFSRLSKVFGVAGLSRCAVLPKDFDEIVKALPYLEEELNNVRTFKVMGRRSDKSFPMNSPEMCMELGGQILSRYPHLKVDVKNPQLTVTIEIRDFGAYLHAGQKQGAGGMPVGTAGKAALLISGGIDSPVAGYMMAKRGLEIEAIHFASPPYTSERALMKVKELCAKMAEYTGRIFMTTVNFTEIQEEIAKKCPEEYFTLIMRRFMMEIASKLASNYGSEALITGESVAQVASQTMRALSCTQDSSSLLVFRPLIGMDKTEIIAISEKIDTFKTSILPYEDCCTVFTPKHPKTNPKLSDIIEIEQRLDREALIKKAIETKESDRINIGDTFI